jgi:outer membrane protein
LLYDFGATPLRAEIARESVLATRQTLLAVEQNVLQRAVAAYMNVRRSSEFVALRNNNVRLISQELRAARDRFEVGEVTRTDVALAEARLAAARSGLAAAQGDLMRAQEEYRAAVGHKPRSLSAPPRVPNAAKSVDAAKAIARRNHPEMAKVHHDVKAAELSVLLAEAAMKPSIRLTGQYGLSEGLNSSFNNSGGSIGIRAAGPIYQGGRLSSLLRQSMAQRDVARASLHVVRMGVDQSVGNAFAQLSVARASLAATEQQVRASRVAFRGLREEASLGARTTLDVLNAEQELLNAQATQISAMADEQIAAYTLLASMGMLTAEQLRLRVQIYDPEAYYKQVKDAPTLRSKQGQKLDRVLRAIGKE